jgi:hypothetical protein
VRPRCNPGLFSVRSLKEMLPGRLVLVEATEHARPEMKEIASLLDAHSPSDNQAQTEHGFARLVLHILGHGRIPYCPG